MTHSLRLWSVLACALWAAAGCAKTEPPPFQEVRAAVLPEADYLAFAEKVEAAAASGDAAQIQKLIDWDGIIARIIAQTNGSQAMERAFAAGMRSRVGVEGVGAQIVQHVQGGGSYRLLRLRETEHGPRLLFRLLIPGGGVNYHDLIVDRVGGELKIVDLYIYISGETLGATLTRLAHLAMQADGVAAALTGTRGRIAADMETLTKINALVREGKGAEAYPLFAQMSQQIRQDKGVMVIYVLTAQSKGEAEYGEALRQYRTLFPGDASIDMVSIDGYTLRKRYDKALEAIDRVDADLGGDPYLDVMRGNLCILDENYDDAAAAAQKALDAEPTLVDGMWVLVTVALRRQDHAETARLLTQLRDEYEMTFSDLTTAADYAEFVKSPEYAAWLQETPAAP